MSDAANPHRGEAALTADGVTYRLRPSFTALVAAEEELGPLFALVERAAAGQLKLSEVATLFWHCLEEPRAATRHDLGRAIVGAGLAASAKPLRALLGQVLQGGG